MTFRDRPGDQAIDREHAMIELDTRLRELADRRFSTIYADNPHLAQYAEERVTSFAGQILTTLENDANHPAKPTLIGACKKLVFTFTDPQNYENTISNSDIEQSVARAVVLTSNTISMAQALDRTTNYIHLVYLPKAIEFTGDSWEVMSQSARFWYTQGFSEANVPHDFG